MNRVSILAAAICASSLCQAQSGLIGGPFVPGSGNYTTLGGGDFEAEGSLGNWIYQGGWQTAHVYREQAAAQRGSWGCRMTRDFEPPWVYACGNANAAFGPYTVGEKYVLSGFFSPQTYFSEGSVYFDIWQPGVGTVAYVSHGVLTQEMVGNWYFGWTTFTAPSQFLVVRMIHIRGDFQNIPADATSYWDDMAVTRASDFQAVTPVPEPASAIGVLVGLALTLRWRRSKRGAVARSEVVRRLASYTNFGRR